MDKRELSFSEQIFALSNPAPERDIEDTWDEDTTAKVVSAEAEIDGSHDASLEEQPSVLRRKAAVQLGSLQNDTRYKGLKTSRSKLLEFSDDEEDGSDSDEDSDDDESEEGFDDKRRISVAKHLQDLAGKMAYDDSDDEGQEEDDEMERWTQERLKAYGEDETSDEVGDQDVGKYSNEDEEDEDESEDEDDGNESEDDDDNDDGSSGGEEEEMSDDDPGIQGFAQVNISAEVEKGKAVKAQLGLWDSFMQARIKMQKALSIANQLPQPDSHELFMMEGGEELRKLLQSSEKELARLVQSFVNLQDALLSQNPETEHVLRGEEPGKESNTNGEDDDDEEIPSDTDDEMGGDRAPLTAPKPLLPSAKRPLADDEIEEHLAKRHRDFVPFRNATVQKWYEKTRLSTGKLSKKSFSGFERSALLQIQQVLQDRERLVKRTQLRRSEYTVLGQRTGGQRQEESSGSVEEVKEEEAAPQPANQHLKNYDPEIFDDDDFYHQLLRELIEKRSSSTTDPIQLTRQWLQLQKLRSKVKRIVDTKASKGRKLRYDVHEKLISFMAPVNQSTMAVEARSELFKSLFGQSSLTTAGTGR